MATISQVQEVVFRLKLEDQATDAMKAAVSALKDLNKEFDLNDQVVQKAGKGANTLINQNDTISKTAKTLTNVLRDLSSAQKALAADAATGGEKQAALLRTVENLTTKVQSATQAHNDAVKGVKSAGDAHEDAGKKVGLFGLSVQKTGFLVHDATKAIESLTLGMSPFQVAMQHVGQVQGLFGDLSTAAKAFAASFVSVPGALLAATAAVVGFGVVAESESQRLGNLRQQLRATHDDYAAMATAVDAAAKQAAASSSLTTSQAREAAQTIASAKMFSGSQADIVALTKTSQDLARVWNTDVATSAKFLADALNDPAKAAKDLAEKGFPGMSLELAHTITNLQAAGQSGQAYAQVMAVIQAGTVGATKDTSPLREALRNLEERFYGARAGGKSLAVTLGEMVDSFLAIQVRGLDKLIEGLDKFIQKVPVAIEAAKKMPTGANSSEWQFGQTPGQTPAIPSQTTTGSLAQVDASIRPLVEAAAKQYQVDVELLSRLQLSENRAPSGRDLGGNPVWANSSTGAVGPMQVTRSTFGGLSGFAGQNIQDPSTNINAGTSLFAHLLQKYKDPYLAVLAYHDGETLVDRVLRGDTDAQGFSYQASTDARMQAEKVAGAYTGPGNLRPTGAGITAAGGYDQISNPTGNLSAAIRNNNLATSQGAFQTAQGLNPLMQQIEANRAQQDSLQAGIKLATDEGDTEKVKLLSQALAEAKGKATDLITEQAKLARASQDAVAPLQAEEGATRTLALVQQQFILAARASGTEVDQGALEAARASKLHELAIAFDDAVKATDRQTAANARIAASVDQSAPSLIAATNREKALAQAREDFLPGPDQAAQVDRYTTALNRQSAAAADLATAQKSFDQRDQLETIKAETASLGENTNQRDKELALLKERQALLRSGADLQSAVSKADLANVAAISDATAALNLQKSSLSELSSFFTNTFDTIANAITQAFATGNLAALKFGDLAKSVATAVIAEFAKLAILNPLKNWLFGTNDTTLSSVSGVIGKLFGGDSSNAGLPAGEVGLTSTASGVSGLESLGFVTSVSGDSASSLAAANNASTSSGGGLMNMLGTAGTLARAADWLSGGKLISGITDGVKSAFGLGNGTTLASMLTGGAEAATGVAGATVAAGVEAGVSTTAATAGQTVALAAVDDVATAAASGVVSGVASAGITSAVSTIAAAIPYIGAAISVGTELIQGNFRGAALVAVGAVIGSYFGPWGTAIGAAAGALADAFLPHHPLHPFDAAYLDTEGGQLVRGTTVNQAETPQAGAVVDDFASRFNKFMQHAGIALANMDGHIGAVGNGIAGFETVDNPEKLLSRLQFQNDSSDTSQFGVAKGALAGMHFETIQSLVEELTKIASFADTTEALGIKLKAVGTDLTAIQIASVDNLHPDQTGTTPGADGQAVTYLNDLRTALSKDLTSKTFANVQALDEEIAKVNSFVNGTIPGLLRPVEQTTSSIVEQATKIQKAYGEAIDQSLQYGLDNTAALQDAEEQALAIVRRSGVQQIHATAQNMADALLVATGGAGSNSTTLSSHQFEQNAQQQRDALSKLWTDTYGDVTKTSHDYLQTMADLEVTLGAQRVANATAAAQQMTASLYGVWSTIEDVRARYMDLTGDKEAAEMLRYNAKARAETLSFGKTLTDFYGESYAQSSDYQQYMTELERTQQAERLAIMQKYGAAGTSTLGQAQSNVTSLLTGLRDYARSLQSGSNSPLSPTAQYALASRQFNAVQGAAAAGDYDSASQLRTYAEGLLTASRAVYGSGTQYAEDFGRVLDAIQGVATNTDALTVSAQQKFSQDQIDALRDEGEKTRGAIGDLQAEIRAVRRELQQQARAA